MPTLREQQRSFVRVLTDGSGEVLDIPESLTARLEIYANTRRATITNALGLTFPAVRALVGADFFAAMAGEFAAMTPPASAYLNDYGVELPSFLRSYEPAASIDYLAEVAELEWAVSRACHAPDAPRLDPRQLCGLHPEDLARVRFNGHPSVATLHLIYPADRIWRAVLEQDEGAMRAIDLASGPVYVLVERDLEEQVQVRRLGLEEWRLTRGLLAGEPLFRVLPPAQAPQAGGAPLAESAAMTLADHLANRRFIGFRHDRTQGESRS